MFSKYVSSTPLTHGPASEVLTRISAQDYGGDVTLTATLRALLWNRTEDTVTARIASYPIQARGVADRAMDVGARAISDFDDNLVFVSLYGAQNDIKLAIETLEKHFEEQHGGWKRLDKVKAFFKNAMDITCFLDVENKRTVLFLNELNVNKLHYLQCGILAYMPWYFRPEDGITALERDLIESLRKKTATDYERCIQKFYEGLDIREMMIRKKLDGFETTYERGRIKELERSIENLYNTINRYKRDLDNYTHQRFQQDAEMRALEEKLNSGAYENEVMNYFLRNKAIHLMDVCGTEMTFVVDSVLTYFDESTAEIYINNRNSIMYKYPDYGNYRDSSISGDQMKKLLTAIFIDQTLKIHFAAAYSFDSRCTARGWGNYHYGEAFKDSMKNQHINHYSCLGNYETRINEALEHRDYIAAIEQCCASARSLAITDTTVMKKFMLEMYGIYGENGKCIELPDGTRCTTFDAVKWLEEQEEANEQND